MAATLTGSPAPDPARAHVIPCFPCEPEHVPDVTCWCEPELAYRDAITGGETWLHHRLH